MNQSEHRDRIPQSSKDTEWYDLFSRGARDWLRHNEKIRDSVKQRLPELIAGSDVISRPDNRTLRVPVKLLEHYRFRLKDSDRKDGVGQAHPGKVKVGDILRPARGLFDSADRHAGNEPGGVQLLLEFKVDDIVDWLWEELELPNLEPRPGETLVDEQLVREGWDRRGARSRLDRRRTLKEAIKRRSVQDDAPDFTNEDLRFRQLAKRQRPAMNAVVFFLLDASSSMEEADRKLAKAFFFWVLQGLRRQYLNISTVFIAHTATAWEFSEEEFFKVTAQGGTQASSGFALALEILEKRFHPSRYHTYLFYASDGDNFIEDREPSEAALEKVAAAGNFVGYVEIAQTLSDALDTQMSALFQSLLKRGLRVGSYVLGGQEDIWPGIKKFFNHQAQHGAP